MDMIFTEEQINDIDSFIKNIIDDYLIDLYGELNDRTKVHQYTRERIEMLMKVAYHEGYRKAKES